MRIPKYFVWALFLFSLVACVSTQVAYLNPGGERYFPTNRADIKIYFDEREIPGEFIQFAIIKAIGAEDFTTESEMMHKIRETAAEIGADAVFIERIKDQSDAANKRAGGLGIGERKAKVIAIKFKKPETQSYAGKWQTDKSTMSSSYGPNCSGDVFKGGQWCGSQNGFDWLQLDFGSPRSVSEIRIEMAGTDVTTEGARIVLKLQTPTGEWVTVDELRDTNINIFSPLTGGAKGNSIPSYGKVLATPVTAQAFRIEFTGNGWFSARNIQVI